MRIQLKELVNGKWQLVDVKMLKGRTIADYAIDSFVRVMGAVYEDDKPILFVCNEEEGIQTIKDKYPAAVVLSFQETQVLFGMEHVPDIILEVFEGSKFIEAKTTNQEVINGEG